ncbi:hypothetical protein Tco_1055372 [Tanacetum coccineum]|uniref:Retrovirus-related Pol polyprotein from transposon TNT 1-94-like beta-barrel domain-containing protein n=1 Tax=Tanacetum coccineum TaxID=301880 RepID=A0ABQ5H0W9_9ASTR
MIYLDVRMITSTTRNQNSSSSDGGFNQKMDQEDLKTYDKAIVIKEENVGLIPICWRQKAVTKKHSCPDVCTVDCVSCKPICSNSTTPLPSPPPPTTLSSPPPTAYSPPDYTFPSTDYSDYSDYNYTPGLPPPPILILGHAFWKCQNKKKDARIEKQKKSVKPTNKNVAEKIKYPEKVHVITDYMIEGTDDAIWDEVWYVSSAYKNHMCPTRPLFKKLTYKFKMIEKEEIEKKFIFSYGVGDVTVEAREGNLVIPNVHYTPEVTLNAQEESFTEDDGSKDVVTEHNKFLDEYFESIDPKEECSLVNGLENLKWDRNDIQDYVDEEYISWNGSLYALKKKPPVKAYGNQLLSTQDIDSLGVKGCYKKFIDMVQVYYETAKIPWYIKKPKEDVVESSSGNARVKYPQGKEKDDAGIEEALEKDMNKKTQFRVRLEGNMEEEAEEGSTTDSNDFVVII